MLLREKIQIHFFLYFFTLIQSHPLNLQTVKEEEENGLVVRPSYSIIIRKKKIHQKAY